jgi:hypothetical protein
MKLKSEELIDFILFFVYENGLMQSFPKIQFGLDFLFNFI